MDRGGFWRLVWKEYRMQRAVWLAMVALTLLVQVLVVVFSRAERDSVDWVEPPFAFALVFSALYALGCGATLFATERETGTYEFQRSVPVSWLRLFAAKVAWAGLSTLAIIGVLWGLAACVARWQFPQAAYTGDVWGLFGFGAVELLLWGILFSLVLDQPLVAAILAVATVSTYLHVLAQNTYGFADHIACYTAALPWRAAIAAGVGLVDLWLARRWFHGGRKWLAISVGHCVSDEAVAEAALPPQPDQPSRWVFFGHLLWQQWRQSRGLMFALAVAALPAVGSGAWYSRTFGSYHPWSELRAVTAAVSLLAGLMGACVFLGDQRREQYRFLAERAARPGAVWLSRQVIWAVPLVLLAGLLVPYFLVTEADVFGTRVYSQSHSYSGLGSLDVRNLIAAMYMGGQALELLVCAFAAYAAGQFCSMFFRSGILAAVFGLALAGGLCFWTLLMRSLYLSLFWTVLPIPLALVAATRLRTADWILHRNTLRAWWRPACLVLASTSAVLAAVPWMRVNNIPAMPQPILSAGEYEREPTAEEKETEALYQKARDAYVARPPDPGPAQDNSKTQPEAPPDPKLVAAEDGAWVQANRETIARLLAATQRPLGDVGHPPRRRYSPAPTPDFFAPTYLLRTAAHVAQREARLDQAMEYYLAMLRLARYEGYYFPSLFGNDWTEILAYQEIQKWSVLPGQTPARIASLLAQLEKLIPTFPSRCNALKAQYVLARDLIRLDPNAVQAVRLDSTDVFWMSLCNRWFPWEQTRALRFLDTLISRELWYCQAMEDPLAGKGQVTKERWQDICAQRHRNLPNPSILPKGFVPELGWGAPLETLQIKTLRALVQVVLGLEAWRLAHGRLPDSLKDLVGAYFKQLPDDPSSHGPFGYLPQGLPFDVVPGTEWLGERFLSVEGPARVISSGTPVLVSPRAKIISGSHARREGSDDWYQHYASTGVEAWYADGIFPLPHSVKEQKAATADRGGDTTKRTVATTSGTGDAVGSRGFVRMSLR